MQPNIKSIRPFVGSKDFQESKRFYELLGFKVNWVGDKMSFLALGDFGFYLQDAYVKDWVDNTMLFLEVAEPDAFLKHLESLDLKSQFPKVRLSKMVTNDWGPEFFLHDPAGVLWHIGAFYT